MGLNLYYTRKRCKTCGHQEMFDDLGYTYNVAPMWFEIYPDDKGMVYIDGMTGKQAESKLKHALDELLKDPQRFKKHNSKNNWGTYDGFVEFIKSLLSLCKKHPDGVWSSWR